MSDKCKHCANEGCWCCIDCSNDKHFVDKRKPLPCPFCGGKVDVLRDKHPHLQSGSKSGISDWFIRCYNCDLFFGYDEDYSGLWKRKQGVVDAWNTRTAR